MAQADDLDLSGDYESAYKLYLDIAQKSRNAAT